VDSIPNIHTTFKKALFTAIAHVDCNSCGKRSTKNMGVITQISATIRIDLFRSPQLLIWHNLFS